MSNGLTFDELRKTIAHLEALRPPQYEIWVSDHLPEKDAEGNDLGYLKMDAMQTLYSSTILPTRRVRRSFLPETDEIIILPRTLFETYREEITLSKIPVFGPRRMRIQ